MEGGHWDPVAHQRNSGHKLQAAAWEKDKLLGIDTSARRKRTKDKALSMSSYGDTSSKHNTRFS